MDLEMKGKVDDVEYDDTDNVRYECMDDIMDRKYYNFQEEHQVNLENSNNAIERKLGECYLEPINPGDYRENCVRRQITHVRSCESSNNSENLMRVKDYSYNSGCSGKCVLIFSILSLFIVIIAFVLTILFLKFSRDEEVSELQKRIQELEHRMGNTTLYVDSVKHDLNSLHMSTVNAQSALVSKVNTIQSRTEDVDRPVVAIQERVHTAFRATLGTPLTPGTSGRIVFGNSTLNEGGAYNTSTGIFTCPEEGYYVFSFSIVSYNGYFSAQLEVNNVWRQFAIADSTTGQHGSSTGVTVTKLKPGDKVWVAVEIKGAGSTLHEYESFFSGWNL